MIDDTQLLLAWERAYGKSPCEQALVLIAAALPQAAADELTRMSIGQRDTLLLKLRKNLFGERMETVASCPECRERLELSFRVDDIMIDRKLNSDPAVVEIDEFRIECRPPNSRDLLTSIRADPSNRTDALLAACITNVQRNGSPSSIECLTEQAKQLLSETLAERDPQADVRLDLSCAACQHRWSSPFDIVTFLWEELNSWCQRLLTEVHMLARTYGWNENEVLALSRWRRQVYLGMVRQ